ncbi:uncharacterized protein LOC128552993 [Mercenaria mercenaria]|uniref:uncharacterized protein LOC128552993 n=1 Tax=Mercenaria mercenaria TaxID=6596 RepID=UPI00234E8087|nr:uncharacterized protein LOC128552993 [Mercenaria mercenaria]
MPQVMISDNAATYLSASNYLKRMFEYSSVMEMLNRRGIEWKFIPSRAPWYGGFWERLIGLTKTTLKKILGKACICFETLQTIVTEIEAIMNDRPLTYISSNFDDPEPLTPAHLLYGRRITSLPFSDYDNDISSHQINIGNINFNKRAKVVAMAIQHFWKRWKSEYLTSLREHYQTTGRNSRSIKVGDIVQIHDDCPRTRWKLAVVEELLPGNDGITRAAKIRTQNGSSTRPVVKLYPLEVIRDSENE